MKKAATRIANNPDTAVNVAVGTANAVHSFKSSHKDTANAASVSFEDIILAIDDHLESVDSEIENIKQDNAQLKTEMQDSYQDLHDRVLELTRSYEAYKLAVKKRFILFGVVSAIGIAAAMILAIVL